jgi:hypothetical protein
VRLTARIGEYYNRRKKGRKPIVHFAVAAHEYTNAVGGALLASLFLNLSAYDKPIGASPGRDYVLTRMVVQII